MKQITLLSLLLLFRLACKAGAQELLTITKTGENAERLNLVMLAEGYTAAELADKKFETDAKSISNDLLDTEPFKSYRPFFNVYGIAVASAQSGADQGTAGGNVDTYFNASFNNLGIDRLLTIDYTGRSRAFGLLLSLVPDYDIVLVIVNDTKYGGSGGDFAVTSTNREAPEIAIHEIGHSLAWLGDEYDNAGGIAMERPNTTQAKLLSEISWNHWINATTPIPTLPEMTGYGSDLVGLFEGAAYHPKGWYRPTLNSKMRTLGEPFYAVNEEAIILSFYNRVRLITSTSPATDTALTVNQTDKTLSFTVDGPNTAVTAPAIKVEWKVDGVVIPGQTARTLTRLSSLFGNGLHTLVATVTDPSLKIRKNADDLLSDTCTWTLNLINQRPSKPTGLRVEQ